MVFFLFLIGVTQGLMYSHEMLIEPRVTKSEWFDRNAEKEEKIAHPTSIAIALARNIIFARSKECSVCDALSKKSKKISNDFLCLSKYWESELDRYNNSIQELLLQEEISFKFLPSLIKNSYKTGFNNNLKPNISAEFLFPFPPGEFGTSPLFKKNNHMPYLKINKASNSQDLKYTTLQDYFLKSKKSGLPIFFSANSFAFAGKETLFYFNNNSLTEYKVTTTSAGRLDFKQAEDNSAAIVKFSKKDHRFFGQFCFDISSSAGAKSSLGGKSNDGWLVIDKDTRLALGLVSESGVTAWTDDVKIKKLCNDKSREFLATPASKWSDELKNIYVYNKDQTVDVFNHDSSFIMRLNSDGSIFGVACDLKPPSRFGPFEKIFVSTFIDQDQNYWTRLIFETESSEEEKFVSQWIVSCKDGSILSEKKFAKELEARPCLGLKKKPTKSLLQKQTIKSSITKILESESSLARQSTLLLRSQKKATSEKILKAFNNKEQLEKEVLNFTFDGISPSIQKILINNFATNEPRLSKNLSQTCFASEIIRILKKIAMPGLSSSKDKNLNSPPKNLGSFKTVDIFCCYKDKDGKIWARNQKEYAWHIFDTNSSNCIKKSAFEDIYFY